MLSLNSQDNWWLINIVFAYICICIVYLCWISFDELTQTNKTQTKWVKKKKTVKYKNHMRRDSAEVAHEVMQIENNQPVIQGNSYFPNTLSWDRLAPLPCSTCSWVWRTCYCECHCTSTIPPLLSTQCSSFLTLPHCTQPVKRLDKRKTAPTKGWACKVVAFIIPPSAPFDLTVVLEIPREGMDHWRDGTCGNVKRNSWHENTRTHTDTDIVHTLFIFHFSCSSSLTSLHHHICMYIFFKALLDPGNWRLEKLRLRIKNYNYFYVFWRLFSVSHLFVCFVSMYIYKAISFSHLSATIYRKQTILQKLRHVIIERK